MDLFSLVRTQQPYSIPKLDHTMTHKSVYSNSCCEYIKVIGCIMKIRDQLYY